MQRFTTKNNTGKGSSLKWRMIGVLLIASMVPLMIAGFGSWIVFGRLLEGKSLEFMESVVSGHARAIEADLSERTNLLRLLTRSNSLAQLSDRNRLAELLGVLNEATDSSFVDLGVIDSHGRHVAYVGPYDLQSRNYQGSEWFHEVMDRGVFISDVFLGFRQVPHCIIAVRSAGEGEPWILRATIGSAQLDRLVRSSALGEGSDAFIVNRAGLYQTTPRGGSLLDKMSDDTIDAHPGLRDVRITRDGRTKIRVTTWINDNRWMLVIEQDLAAVKAPVNRAIAAGAKVVILAFMFLIVITFLATRHLTNMIDRADAEREKMSRAFMRSAKLASIGELATGLAHEINNPLAIISAEQTNIADLIGAIDGGSAFCDDVKESVERSKHQVVRCANITRKMLQFGRDRETSLEFTDIAPRLNETVLLMQRRANVRNIRISLDVEEDLPGVLTDPVELEQVLVNLINNSIDALPDGGDVIVRAFEELDWVHIEVEDNGMGISEENLERVFEPFFTTKPAGKGTGLGLSVCYGLVSSWGGQITARSTWHRGTTIDIRLPLRGERQAAGKQGGAQ